LDDLGIVDLLQFPHKGRKSGELVISHEDREARFYYENGALIHAYTNDETGLEALVGVVGWREGSFEFLLGVDSTEKTIDMDLPRALMQALKLHDERKMMEAEQVSEPEEGSAESKTAHILKEFVQVTDFALHAAVLNTDGTLLASADKEAGGPEDTEQLRASLMELVWAYPRRSIRRAIIEDDMGTVVLATLTRGGCLVLLTNGEVPLGAISMAANKLVAAFE
jgi:predicted regulator of Ras-like GTPase activity (Roadblock/LC7/MglB family)